VPQAHTDRQLSDGGVFQKKDAELLVYLVDEEMDIYISVLVAVCHSLSYLAVAESLRTGKWRATPWSIQKGRNKDLDTLPVHPDVRRTPKRV
jgi:hypothetical protein